VFSSFCRAPEQAIGKIYGRVVTEEGEMMAKQLFFSPLWSTSDTAYEWYKTFMQRQWVPLTTYGKKATSKQ
jgi:hypothetical protein